MDKNRLGEETSPYLLQHRDNPVHWQPWGEATLAAAKAADKPILLSIGYAACHWCHVMAHESFEDPAIAARDERALRQHQGRPRGAPRPRPDLPARAGADGRAGRLAVDDVPDARRRAVLGRHLFPARGALGPAGLSARCWTRSARPMPRQARRGSEERRGAARGVAAARRSRSTAAPIARPQLDPIAERLLREVDPINGGIGTAPKFPQCGIFELLWRAWKRTRQTAYRDAVLKALDAMCQGGIYDHLGGGFARYSTDARWLAPHFEKMLYDNAELVDLLTLVWQETRNPLYRQRIAETLGWVEREMLTPGGGFASSLDADSEHEEGKFYVWSEAEIDAVLGDRAALFKRFYDVTPDGNWEGHTILNRLATPALADDATEARAGANAASCCCRRAQVAGAAGLGRQGAGRLERADDRGDGRRRHRVRAAGLDRDGARAPSTSSAGEMVDGGRAAARTAGATAGRAIRPVSTITPISAAPRWRCTRRPATTISLPRRAAWIAILDRHYWDPAGGGYFFSADDTAGADRPRQDRRRCRHPRRQRHARRGLDAARAPDRRGRPIAAAPKRSSRPFPASSGAISFRSRPCSTTPSCWPSRCRSSSSASPADPAVRRVAPGGLRGFAAEPRDA